MEILLKSNRFVELILEVVQVLRILIILKTTLRGKSKRLSKRNLLQENLPMKAKILMSLKNKTRIFLFLMLRLKIIILKKKNHLRLKKNNNKKKIRKNLNLLRKKTLNYLLRRIKRRSKNVKKGIHGCKGPYHIPKR